MRKAVLIAAAVLVAAGLAAWLAWPVAAPKIVELRPLAVASQRALPSSLIVVASREKLFVLNGLDVRLEEDPSGPVAMESMTGGRADLAVAADYSVVSMLPDHPELQVLATIASADTVEVVARLDRAINEPGDIKGKTVGIARNTISEYFLSVFLLANGLSDDEVNAVDVRPDALADALYRGEVDAIVAWDVPAEAASAALGGEVRRWPAQNGQEFLMAVVTRQDVLDAHANELRRFLRSLVQADTYVHSHESTAKALTADALGLAPRRLDSLWGRVTLGVSLDQSLIVSMENAAQWLSRTRDGAYRSAPNILDHIALGPLVATAPRTITIFR